MSTISLPTRIRFMNPTQCFQHLTQAALGHPTVLFLTEKDAERLDLNPFIEAMKASGQVTWNKDVPSGSAKSTCPESVKPYFIPEHALIVAIGSAATLDTAKRCAEGQKNTTLIGVPTNCDMISILSAPAFDQGLIVSDFALRSIPSITLAEGMNALGCATDAYWAKTSSRAVQCWALQSIRLIIRSLPKVLLNPDSVSDRQQLTYGSLLAAMAFRNSQPAVLTAFSAVLSAHSDIDPGLARVLFLPNLLRHNLGALTNPESLYEAFNIDNPEALGVWIEKTAQGLTSLKLSDYGLTDTDLDAIADRVVESEKHANNPVPLTLEHLKTILKLHL